MIEVDPALNQLYQNVELDNKIVTGKDLDYETYEKKFAQWDYVIKRNMLMSSSDFTRNRALRLLNDDTIFAYAYLRDDDGKPFKFTAYQDLIGQCKHDFTPNNPNRYILFIASNQVGKSRFLIGKALKIAMTEENKNVIMVSRTLPQSQFLLAQLKQALNNIEFSDSWREDLGDQKNTTVLTFKRDILDKNGKTIRSILNRIICAPAGEGLLGYPAHYLFLDEADFYENSIHFFEKVAKPRTNKTKGQIIIFSNPNNDVPRSQCILYKQLNGDLFKRKFKFNIMDAPWFNQDEFNTDKRNTASHTFMSTHLGEYAEEGGAFLSQKEIEDMMVRDWTNSLPITNEPVYISLDLGKMNDNTVLSIGTVSKPKDERDKYMDLNIRYQEKFPLRTDYDVIVDRLKVLIEHYQNLGGVSMVGYDSTGQKTFGDLLKVKGVNAVGIDFSRKESNKTLLYNDFKLMAENRKIKCVYSHDCEKQLGNLVFKLTESKKFKKVESKTELIHDDYPDSMVILIHIAVKPSTVPVSAAIVGRGSNIQEKEDSNEASGQSDIDAYIAKTIQQNNSINRSMSPYGYR